MEKATILQNPMIEEMQAFFTDRIEGYDAHMLEEVVGCREGYAEMARLLPDRAETLLDLGCGTGLELAEIYDKLPNIAVTGIDLTQAMLDRLRAKYPMKPITLIQGSYLDRDFGAAAFDAAVSFETMHHLTHRQKADLYGQVRKALKPGGRYVECDYMVLDQAEEDLHFAEYRRLLAQQENREGRYSLHRGQPGSATAGGGLRSRGSPMAAGQHHHHRGGSGRLIPNKFL